MTEIAMCLLPFGVATIPWEGWGAAGYPAYIELLKKAAEHD